MSGAVVAADLFLPLQTEASLLGLELTDWDGVIFEPMTASPTRRQSSAVWSIFPADTT